MTLMNRIVTTAVVVSVLWVLFHAAHQTPASTVTPTPAPAPTPVPAPKPPIDTGAPGAAEPDCHCNDGKVLAESPAESPAESSPEESPVESSAPAPGPIDFDVAQFVHRADINGGVQYGSCVAVSGTGYVTARHIFQDARGQYLPLKSVSIDGQQVAVNVTHHADDITSLVVSNSSGGALPADELPTESIPVLVYGIQSAQIQHGTLHWIIGSNIQIPYVHIDEADPGVTQGDSGGGVFTEDGKALGVISAHKSDSRANTKDVRQVYFAPLPGLKVKPYASAPAAIGPHTPSAPSAADSAEIGFRVARRNDGRWWWNDGVMDRWSAQQPREGMRFSDNAVTFIYHDGRMLPADVILQFGAVWCVPCKPAHDKIKPDLEAMGWPVVEVDADQKRGITDHWRVTNLPAFIVIRDGREVSRSYGAVMPVKDGPAPEAVAPVFNDDSLAGRLVQHCSTDNKSAGYSSVLGMTLKLSDLVSPRMGSPITLANGVTLTVPRGCKWQVTDQGAGNLKIAFSGQLPTVTAAKSILKVQPEITAIDLKFSASAVEAQASLKRFPDFTVTVSLGSP